MSRLRRDGPNGGGVVTVRAEDLPPAVRARLGAPPKAKARRTATLRGGRWHCHTCGQAFTAWAPAERHGQTQRHPRIDCELR